MTMLDSWLHLLYMTALLARIAWRRLLRVNGIGVRALVVRGEEVLLVRHRGGLLPWGLPGGAVGHGELLPRAAEREVAEEAGCTVRVAHLHGVFAHYRRGYKDYVVVFACTPLSDINPPRHSLEIAAAAWFPLHALPAGADVFARERVAEQLRGARSVF